MSTQLITVSNVNAKMRWKEPYVSEGLNKKFYGPVAPGIVRGGYLTTSLAAMTVEVHTDPIESDSVYTVSDGSGHQLTVRETATRVLSLSGVASTTVYIGLRVVYATGANTVVEWRAYSKAELDALTEKVAIVGRVVVPAAGVIPAVNIKQMNRTDAWQSDAPGNRDWFQVTENGSSELPTPGLAADRQQPFLRLSTDGAATVVHSSTQARTGAYSIRVGGTTGNVRVTPQIGAAAEYVHYPVKAGQRIMYSFWAYNATWTPAQERVVFAFRQTPVSGAAVTTVNEDVTTSGASWARHTGIVIAPNDGYFQWYFHMIPGAGNAGFLYLDDIRVWVETGEPLEDPNQSFIKGFNREVTGGSLALVPTLTPDNIQTWADSTVRLINTSLADGSAISVKMTADPLNDADDFEFNIRGFIESKSRTTSRWALDGASSYDAAGGVRGTWDGTNASAGGYGVYGKASNLVIDAERAVGVVGEALSGTLGTRRAFGVIGRAQDQGGESVGVYGFATTSGGWLFPDADGAGVVGYGIGSVEPSYWSTPTNVGVVGLGGTGGAYAYGVQGWGKAASSGDAGRGAFFRGGDHSGSGGDGATGAEAVGGDTSGDGDSDGGYGVFASGGDTTNAASTGDGGHGTLSYGGDAAGSVSGNGGQGVSGYGGDANAGNAGVGVRGEGGDSTSGNGGAGGYFVAGTSGSAIPAVGVRGFGGEGTDVGGDGGHFDGADANGASANGGYGIRAKGGNRAGGDPALHGHGGYFETATAAGPGIGVVGRGQFERGYGGAFENDNADRNTEAVLLNSGIEFQQRSGATDSANPTASEAVGKNTLKASNVPKAWAHITTGPGKQVNKAFNIDTTLGITSSRLIVTMREPMDHATQYCPVVNVCDDTTLPVAIQAIPVSTTVFWIKAWSLVGGGAPNALIDLNALTLDLSVAVFGIQTADNYSVPH